MQLIRLSYKPVVAEPEVQAWINTKIRQWILNLEKNITSEEVFKGHRLGSHLQLCSDAHVSEGNLLLKYE
jgi:mRNA-degrading endonuclease YafQ of YafQ-DinJ toxin-antitoxin module